MDDGFGKALDDLFAPKKYIPEPLPPKRSFTVGSEVEHCVRGKGFVHSISDDGEYVYILFKCKLRKLRTRFTYNNTKIISDQEIN